MNRCETAKRIGLGTYAPMDWTTEIAIQIELTGKKTGPSEPGNAASLDMLKLLLGTLHELYSGKACIEEPD